MNCLSCGASLPASTPICSTCGIAQATLVPGGELHAQIERQIRHPSQPSDAGSIGDAFDIVFTVLDVLSTGWNVVSSVFSLFDW